MTTHNTLTRYRNTYRSNCMVPPSITLAPRCGGNRRRYDYHHKVIRSCSAAPLDMVRARGGAVTPSQAPKGVALQLGWRATGPYWYNSTLQVRPLPVLQSSLGGLRSIKSIDISYMYFLILYEARPRLQTNRWSASAGMYAKSAVARD